jgi:hypothetical protein
MINRFISKDTRGKLRKIIAVYLAISLFFEIIYPTCAFALSGGPSQPEVQSFEPIGTSDMVDLFSGDFTYNIPLIDIDGYPINISYHSGVSMDQEASWVGLGWNINPGVVNRAMRGVPDDFKGDVVKKEFNMKPNRTYGVTGGFGAEFFGLDNASINYSLGLKYNNYSGVGIERSLNASLSTGEKAKGSGTIGLGLTSSSDNGLSVNPSASFSVNVDKETKIADGSSYKALGGSVGLAFNGRAGLQQLSITANANKGVYEKSKSPNKDGTEKFSKVGNNTFAVSAAFNYGTPTYSPSVDMPMHNFSFTGRFTTGGALFGLHGNFSLNGYYSSQKLITTTQENPAYGYMNNEEGQYKSNSLMDYNREKDGGFTANTPALPLTSLTYDLYSVSGQGVGGSYRAFRSDIGYIHDAGGTTTSDGGSLGLELGAGAIFHGGTDISITSSNTYSGNWTVDNKAASKLKYNKNVNGTAFEKYYFKEANEKSVDSDPDYFAKYGGDNPQRFKLNQQSKFQTILEDDFVDQNGALIPVPSSNKRTKRDKRNQLINAISRAELEQGYGLNSAHSSSYNAPDHHIGEITTYDANASRYVYGIAAYNTTQIETTFSVGENVNGNGAISANCSTNLLTYVPGVDNSVDNDHGNDNYFSRTTTPAFAHSYLLTAVLSPDYIDADAIKGPSDGDFGYYTKFHYSKIENYKWRTPIEANSATYNEGLKSDKKDDKANYVYGEKELWYIDSIVSKNYIAIFHTEARDDGYGVLGENGGIDTTSAKAMRLLRKISLYSIREYRNNPSTAVPIKEVHFEYDYSLCQGIPNQKNPGQGKLTLKKIYFTYQNSTKARLSPYEFSYHDENPDYNIKQYDRWGNYKPDNSGGCDPDDDALSPAEFPYSEQNKVQADLNAAAWNLDTIQLPSGGIISVEYESDDYAWVQHKRAMQMFKIIGVEGSSDITSITPRSLSIGSGNKNKKVYFELQDGYTDVDEYFKGVDEMYFRCLMNFEPYSTTQFDFVSGYTEILEYGDTTIGSTQVGWVKLKPVKMKDNGGTDYNPIVKAAIQYGRLHLPQLVWDQPGVNENDGLGVQLLNAIINSGFAQNIADALSGPNLAIYNRGKGVEMVTQKSWIRLNNPGKKKLGGGLRVKKILMSDSWNTMTDSAMEGFAYGQEYSYEEKDGTSSGVAAYEPLLGGDENPWKEAVAFSNELKLAPDDEFYQEKPYGESFFPSASVGYRRVTVKNLSYSNVTRHATGKVVHEFYTAKDFPTIVKKTEVDHIQAKTDPFSITNMFYVNSKDYMTATQGFSIETNDMHGKPKTQNVYQEGINEPITSVEYRYQCSPYIQDYNSTSTEIFTETFKLDNEVTTISNKGVTSTSSIGVFFDMVADMRQQKSETVGSTTAINVDGFPLGIIPITIPMILPSFSEEKTQFRSATTTKVIQRFGLLEQTEAHDLGSKVLTNNLAYDAETGDVLLTQTTTNFNDQIYTLNYPAHWYYDGMSQAYKNIGVEISGLTFTSGVAPVPNANQFYSLGDEVILSSGIKAWVSAVTSSSVTMIKKDGESVTGTSLTSKVLRSGRKNLQTVPISNITLISNPLTSFTSNIFENVLQSSAMEFSEDWRTFCDCFDTEPQYPQYTTNPYVLGTKGIWRMKKSWLHLSPRVQENYNNNTDIRRDGVFRTYSPFYKVGASGWKINEKNWTFTSEVTEFSPFGQELENRDALGRYSAAAFGYRQSLAIAVAANSQYRDIGFDNFEDYGFSPCADNHFKFGEIQTALSTQSHSGKYSVKVSAGTPLEMNKQLAICAPLGCDLTLTQTGAKVQTVTVTGGTVPYEIDYEIISGDPTITPGTNSISIDGTGIKVEITVTDAKGCKEIKIVTL